MFTLCRRVFPVLCILALTPGLTAQISTAQIDLSPAFPSTNDTVSYKLSGIWRNGCVPESPAVSVSGYSVRIETVNPDAVCTQALTPWSLAGSIGKLAAGDYRLVVTYAGLSGAAAVEIASRTFTVSGSGALEERIFPIVVNGLPGEAEVHYQTTFNLVNTGLQGLSASLDVFDGSGNPQGAFCSPVAPPPSSLRVSLNPGAALHETTSADLPFLNGWARVRWEGPDTLFGSTELTMIDARPEPCLLVCNRPSSEILSTTQTPAVRPAQEFRLPVIINRNRQTAVAVVNPSSAAAIKVKFLILDQSGTQTSWMAPSSFEVTLRPQQRISEFLWELAVKQSALTVLFPLPDMFHGSVRIISDGPMAVGAANVLFPDGKFENVVVAAPQ